MPNINNSKKSLIVILGSIVIIGFAIAKLYYNHVNKSNDPRIIEARELYGKYDSYAESNNFKAIFLLLDSVEFIYQSVEHYQRSYEIGVLHNNRSAAYLAMAIFHEDNCLSLDGISILSKDTLLSLSKIAALKSIQTYEDWLNIYSEKDEEEIHMLLTTNFLNGLTSYSDKELKRFTSSRINEIKEAQLETPRRLSVAYTNLGIVMRHRENYELAIEYYKKAMDLWDRNLAAENSLNALLGQPQKKRNFIEKILPPPKDK
ncbi:tetratricopeptide repeat protein [Carboxylicivirga sp. N1Y90]|uniref:tetratricopeptide repeat protein n=1 Tax=Carboxylicivirga fragile TaxID=3417571 RepID=UPI003D33A03B|nr:tetratricopeptide repeat protein [Marinilabiliaceae bacterium N1Y90]